MKLREIRVLLAAESDLLHGRSFYDDQVEGLGDYFTDSVIADLGSLALYGGIHRRVYGFHRLLCRRFPFAIYYEVETDRVVVVAILDMRSSPTWIKRSLTKRRRSD